MSLCIDPLSQTVAQEDGLRRLRMLEDTNIKVAAVDFRPEFLTNSFSFYRLDTIRAY